VLLARLQNPAPEAGVNDCKVPSGAGKDTLRNPRRVLNETDFLDFPCLTSSTPAASCLCTILILRASPLALTACIRSPGALDFAQAILYSQLDFGPIGGGRKDVPDRLAMPAASAITPWRLVPGDPLMNSRFADPSTRAALRRAFYGSKFVGA
jgi:hypothetical protein